MLKQTKVNPKKLCSLGYLAHFFVASSSYTLNWSQLKLRKFYPPESDSFKYTDERRGSRKLIPKKNRTLFCPHARDISRLTQLPDPLVMMTVMLFIWRRLGSHHAQTSGNKKKNSTRLGEYSIWHAQTGFNPAWKKEWSKKMFLRPA